MRHIFRLSLFFLGTWALWSFLGKYVEYRSSLLGPIFALVMTLSLEGMRWAASEEREVLSARRFRILRGIRIGSLLLLAWILLDPVWTRVSEEKLPQEVVVLIDDSRSMKLVDEGRSETRQELAMKELADCGLLEELEGKVRVREMYFARSLKGGNAQSGGAWDQSTDLAGAFDSILETVPPNQLAGIILLSDGQHNRPGSVEDVVRRFGAIGAPVVVFPSGSADVPRDLAWIDVQAPDSVYLSDRLRVKAVLKADGFRGKEVRVRFLEGETVLEERTVSVPQEQYREEIEFQHLPEEGGVGEYRLEIVSLEGERFLENNDWKFQTVISDARTNVLLVDYLPRWEFRYLRNLFHGRDQSIKLQSVLLSPDRIMGQKKVSVPASAERAFGDSTATDLPVSEAEWRKFDVIILGDLSASDIGEAEWGILKRCVEERGALLVLIAGPQSMPHRHQSGSAKSLFPVTYHESERTYFGGDEEFRYSPTVTGKRHPILVQAEGQFQNEQVWGSFPKIRWRHPITGVKPGAEVLLYAGNSRSERRIDGSGALDEALKAVMEQKQIEAENALLVVHQFGHGKVAALLTDRTWRLRVGVGDQHHHQFWGQLVRWGAGPNLRSGTRTKRLGTDQLTYTADDRVRVLARLWDENFNPLVDEDAGIQISKNGKPVTGGRLRFRKQSNGFYEATFGPFPEAGSYEVRLLDTTVMTGFEVVDTMGSAELSETIVNLPLLEKIAQRSGGRLYTKEGPPSSELFLLGNRQAEELEEFSLWNHPWLLGLLIFFLFTEWGLRKRYGLP